MTDEQKADNESVDVLHERIAKLEKDLKKLDIQNDRILQDKVDVSTFLQQKLKEAQETIQQLQKQIEEKDRIAKATPNIEKAVYNARLLELQEEIKGKDETLRQQAQKLRKLDSVVEENSLLSSEVERVREEHTKAQKDFEATIEALKLTHMEKEHQMQDEMKAELREIQMNAMQNAKKKLNQVSRELINDNASLKESLIQTKAKCRELTDENTELKEQLEKIKRTVSLQTHQSELYAEVKQKNSEDIKKLNAKVGELQDELKKEKETFNRDRRALAHRAELEVEIARSEADTLRHLLNLRIEEENKIKLLAQTILNERSDVEQFLIEALQTVRAQIRASEEEKQRQEEQSLRERASKLFSFHASQRTSPRSSANDQDYTQIEMSYPSSVSVLSDASSPNVKTPSGRSDDTRKRQDSERRGGTDPSILSQFLTWHKMEKEERKAARGTSDTKGSAFKSSPKQIGQKIKKMENEIRKGNDKKMADAVSTELNVTSANDAPTETDNVNTEQFEKEDEEVRMRREEAKRNKRKKGGMSVGSRAADGLMDSWKEAEDEEGFEGTAAESSKQAMSERADEAERNYVPTSSKDEEHDADLIEEQRNEAGEGITSFSGEKAEGAMQSAQSNAITPSKGKDTSARTSSRKSRSSSSAAHVSPSLYSPPPQPRFPYKKGAPGRGSGPGPLPIGIQFEVHQTQHEQQVKAKLSQIQAAEEARRGESSLLSIGKERGPPPPNSSLLPSSTDLQRSFLSQRKGVSDREGLTPSEKWLEEEKEKTRNAMSLSGTSSFAHPRSASAAGYVRVEKTSFAETEQGKSKGKPEMKRDSLLTPQPQAPSEEKSSSASGRSAIASLPPKQKSNSSIFPAKTSYFSESGVEDPLKALSKQNDKTSLESLSWKQKEQVLRVLFAKINQGSHG
ncbi:uncharacterized protein MONOS_1592 [Monocercomonoides exilis]|uniref:uncharacterized protein n=1 Tax=Monocercomonoides exilis TaxID=2049356 RepID=UPI003559D440|nr:hypothetical protein MONOS_1592 [Monocercomonoides exilis]|eukprot:MONOS_1592.1-p1 / transcript=MONOS_1592.1 / gene=MONOS_1592 / organism=Monocercomonoides_exilis_PA203 / gene_product=unspecified product / transcript_product=unspecified product / location=Mono_scaffold00028:165894-169599(+) / protein_length=911 / sequence_SO=supercontig / SO=protein_coding / is_pseudo=false